MTESLRSSFLYFSMETSSKLQLTPAPTDFKGPTISICYKRISVIANIENKEILFKGPKNSFRYKPISVTCGSVSAGFNCTILSLNFRH